MTPYEQYMGEYLAEQRNEQARARNQDPLSKMLMAMMREAESKYFFGTPPVPLKVGGWPTLP